MFKRSSSTIRRAALALGLAIATTAAGSAVAPVTASAAPANFTKPILTSTHPWHLALDVSGASTSNGAPVILWWGNGNANQQWTFEQTGQVTGNGVNIYRIRNVNSGKCLTTNGIAGSQLTQYTCDLASPYQKWSTKLGPTFGFSAARIFNPAFGLYVDVLGGNFSPGAKVGVWYPSDGLNQAFI